MPEQRQLREIRIRGLVQGVGFRPFVYRLALRHRLSGWVGNVDDGVVIRVGGPVGCIEKFLRDLQNHPPSAARIYEISQRTLEPTIETYEELGHEPDQDAGHKPEYGPNRNFEEEPPNHPLFRIVRSQSRSNRITQVSPDIAICEDCLNDLQRQPHRISYPFINCTHCGPRFTIIRQLPYDRPSTTMAPFEMCDTCRREYETPDDRRFHAQPVACNVCGPEYTLIRNTSLSHRQVSKPDSCRDSREQMKGIHTGASEMPETDQRADHPGEPEGITTPESRRSAVTGLQAILDATTEILQQGGIIAIKGLGGFHLMCDAENEVAVKRLRDIKFRDRKPFAVMARDHGSVSRFADVNPEEADLLNSWRRPIVLLKERRPPGSETGTTSFRSTQSLSSPPSYSLTNKDQQLPVHLASGINPAGNTVGVMLPYMPFHHLLFDRLPDAVLVMTSGNLTDEPIVTENDDAIHIFSETTEAIITYNRDIHNRTDDSVVFVARKKSRIIRRSRGYVPEPVRLPYSVEGILAAGAELNHCFATGREHEAILSQHIGDLKDPATFAFFKESVDRFCALFRVNPKIAACDMHPDYLSTRYIQELGLPIVKVQHHHAHIAACMAEYHLDEPVIGVCWDGTGLGTDGHIWGGEFFLAGLDAFRRHTHFGYLPLPGGDKAAKETWRTGLSLLYHTIGKDFLTLDIPFVHEIRKKPETGLLLQAIDRQLNTPLSSAAGRLFDAVAAITGVCHYNSFHAEAPMRLESLADEHIEESYPFTMGTTLSFEPMIRAIVTDLQNRVELPVISAKFHNTLISVIFSVVTRMKLEYHTNKVILTGGVFQNRYLLEKTEHLLESTFDVYSPERIPCNDAGIALGQMAVASKKIHRNDSS